MIEIPLGAFEKYFLVRSAADPSFMTSSLRVLDRTLSIERIRETLAALRPLCPVLFSRVETGDDGLSLVALFDKGCPIDDFLVVHDAWGGTPRDFLEKVLARPLNPFTEGLFRFHYVSGPKPLIGLQRSHVAGDGVTFGYFDALFADMYRNLKPADTSGTQSDWPGYSLSSDWLRRTCPPAPNPFTELKKRSATEPFMQVRETRENSATPEPCLIRKILNKDEFSRAFNRIMALKCGTLQYMAACLGLAIERTWQGWRIDDDDFFAVSMPVDFRKQADLQGAWGNVLFPVGVPLLKSELSDIESAAQAVSRRFAEGRKNFLFYMQFVYELNKVKRMPFSAENLIETADGLKAAIEREGVRPLPLISVTEVVYKKPVTCIGEAEVVDALYLSPNIVRRSLGKQAMVSFTLRRYPLYEAKLKEFVQTFFSYYIYGDADHGDEVGYEM